LQTGKFDRCVIVRTRETHAKRVKFFRNDEISTTARFVECGTSPSAALPQAKQRGHPHRTVRHPYQGRADKAVRAPKFAAAHRFCSATLSGSRALRSHAQYR